MDMNIGPEARAYRLLIVDDNAVDQRHYRRVLASETTGTFRIHVAATGGAGLAALRDQAFDCILLDFSLPDMSGLDFLTRIATPAGDLPCAVVLVTGQGSELVAAEAVRRGIQDYVVKSDLPHAELGRMIARAVERVELRAELARSMRALADTNAAMAREVEVRRVAEADAAAARLHAERANQAKSAFLAQMSHELRTPMNGIIGLTSLLLEESLPPHHLDYVQEIYASSQALLRLLNDILDLSKLEAGRVELERIAFDPESVVEDALDMTAHKLGGKTLELCASVDAALRRPCLGDPTRIRQILMNFLDNAVKFTAVGAVAITAAPRLLTGGVAGMRITVTDTGIGIAASALPRLFLPFSQANHETTRLYGGSGLGLAIARQMAQLMGGAVGAAAALGEGARFWVDLPLVFADPHNDAGDEPPYTGLRALILDDSAAARANLRGHLEELGLSVTEAADEAMAAASCAAPGARFDLILMDQDMAERGWHVPAGLECRAIPMLPPGRPPGMGTARDGLVKPIRRAVLQHAASALLGTPSPRPAAPEATQPDGFWRPDCVQRRVLLVEDHPINQKVAMGILRKAGYRVDLASNGASAIARAAQRNYDLILMDLQMPDMGGMEAAGRIRAAENGAHVPIVALTAHAMSGARETCLAQGMDDFIGKPIDARSFLGVVRNWLRTSEAASLTA